MRRTLVIIASLIAAHASADVYEQTFGSSKYENKTIYLQSGGSVTHTFRINGVFGNSVNSFRTDWYSTEDIQGSAGFIESDSSNFGNGYWDPEVTRTYSAAGTYFARGEVMTRDYAWQDFWWKETHQWRITVVVDTTGPTWSSGSVDLDAADDTGRYNNDNVTRNTSGLTFSWPSATDSQIGLDRYEWRLGTSGAWNNRNLNTSVDISAGEGSYTFYVRAVDKAGNASSEKSLSFKVDTTRPNVPSLITPGHNTRTTDTTPYFDWSCSDNTGGSGIWKYDLVVERPWGWNVLDKSGITSSDYTPSTSEALGAGGADYDWRVRSYDVAGNVSADWSSENRFYIDDRVGSVRVDITPASAVSAGAKWQLSGYDSTWRDSGTSVTVSEGSYTIKFNSPSGWTGDSAKKPDDIPVTIQEGSPQTKSGNYRRIVSAYWSHPYPTYQYVYEYTSVDLFAEVEGFAQGESFLFEICEDDDNGIKQVVATVNGTVQYTGGKYIAKASWTAQWEEDGPVGSFGDPEYYFYVSRDGIVASSPNPTVFGGQDGELVVKPREPSGEITGFVNAAGDWEGTARTVTVKVKNTGNDHANLIVSVDSYPSGWNVSPESKQTSVNYNAENISYFTFTVTPPASQASSGTITFKLKFDNWGFWNNTLLDTEGAAVTSYPKGSIRATLKDQNGTAVNGKFYIYSFEPDKVTTGNPGVFTGIPAGQTYDVEGRYIGPFGDEEYWGTATSPSVVGNGTVNVEITRKAPHAEPPIRIYRVADNSEVPADQVLLPGTKVYAKVTVRNRESVDKNCAVEFWYRAGTSGNGTQQQDVRVNVPAGQTREFRLPDYTVVEGDHYCRLKVKAPYYQGIDAYTDTWPWSARLFRCTVNKPVPVSSSIHIRRLEPGNVNRTDMALMASGEDLIPGKRYVVEASFDDADGADDIQTAFFQLTHPSGGGTLKIQVPQTSGGTVQLWYNNTPQDLANNNYLSKVHVFTAESSGNRKTFAIMIWLSGKWGNAVPDGIQLSTWARDTAGNEQPDVGTRSYGYQPQSLPAGKWTVIVHGKSNSMDIWPPNTPYLGFGPWAWGNSMTAWFNRQSSPKTGNEWMWEMAEKIRSIDTNADVRIHRLGDRLNGTLHTWQGGRTGSYSTTFQPSSTGHNILLFDWDDPSDYVDIDDPDRMHGFAYGAADALWALIGKAGAQDSIHCLVGYSRGGVVVSETARRVLLAGKAMPHVLLVDAEGWAPYVDKEFHAWKGTRTDQYRSQSGEWTAVLSMWCGGDPLPESDGNDRTVENWPQYSVKSGSIGHGGYPSYLTEWCYLALDGTKGVLIETPQILRDDRGAQTIKYANTLTPTRPDGLYWGLYNGGFEWLSAAGWTYHGGTTPWTPGLSWLGNDLCSAELDLFGTRLVHNWARSPDNARTVRYWVTSYSLIRDTAQLQQGWYGSSSYRSMDYLQVEDVWWDPVVRTYRFDYGGQVGRVSFDALNLNIDSQVLIDDVGFIESAPPVVGTLTGNPNPVVQGANLRLVAGGVIPGDNPVSEVRFYRDSNGNGVYDAGTDTSFGVAYSGSSGNWEVTQGTAGIPVGQHYFFALAKDSDGLWSAAVRSAARIEVTQPVNQSPTIGSLSDSPDPVDRGANLTLTASSVADADGTVARVDFYHDANNNGVFDEGAGALMGTDTTIVGGQAAVTFGTGSLPAGTRRFFAVAYDNQGAASGAASCRTTIIQKWNLSYQVSPVGSGTITENPVAGRYADGTQIDPSAAAAATYRFDHWEVNGVTKTMPVTLTADTTVKAVFVYNGPTVVPPVLNAIGNQSVNAGVSFSLTVTKQQGDTPITWTLESAPSGMTINSSGVISWPNPTPAGSSHFITVKAANSAGNDTESFTLYVLAPPDTTRPTVQITVPTPNATYTSTTNLLNFAGTASDNAGISKVTIRNCRDLGGYVCSGTTAWQFNGMPLYQGQNLISVIATDTSGNSATDTVTVTYSGDPFYDGELRSGAVVQEITFPDNLVPGQTVTVRWKLLSYVPIRSCLDAGKWDATAGAWTWGPMIKNGTCQGQEDSTWNISMSAYGRKYAATYAFECDWVVPNKPGDFQIWFNVAQMDGKQYMIATVPEGVDARPDPTSSKVIIRTIAAGGTDANPQSEARLTDPDQQFDTLTDSKKRSGGAVIGLTLPDNLTQGSQVTCEWTVMAYMDIDAEMSIVDFAVPAIVKDGIVGSRIADVASTYNFVFGGTRYYAREYTFRATFTVPNSPGEKQIYFRHRLRGDANSIWMSANIAPGVDTRAFLYNGMYGRFIERTINP